MTAIFRVGISLEIPAGKTDAIHSLRIRLSVTASEEITGTFAFDSNIQTTVQDAAWSKQNSVYIMDVILSGKQDLISENGTLSLGTLSLTSDSAKSWSAEIGISENSLEYVNSFGTYEKITDMNVTPVTVKVENAEPEPTPTATPIPPGISENSLEYVNSFGTYEKITDMNVTPVTVKVENAEPEPTPTATPIPPVVIPTATPIPPEPPVIIPTATPVPPRQQLRFLRNLR